jgi:probable rRNA maturation factor
MRIEINNLTTSQVNEDFIKEISRRVLKGEESKLSSSLFANAREGEGKEENISFAFIGSERIRELNKRYRGENRVTDVLTFGEDLKEIVICLREVKQNAKRYETTFEKELALVLIHGILHLLGYDHEKNEMGAKEMREKEEYYSSQLKT